jgi:hypothetical protein
LNVDAGVHVAKQVRTHIVLLTWGIQKHAVFNRKKRFQLQKSGFSIE